MQKLDLSGNQFNGTVPAALGGPQLQQLVLANNMLSGKRRQSAVEPPVRSITQP